MDPGNGHRSASRWRRWGLRPGVIAFLSCITVGIDFTAGSDACRAAADRTDWHEARRACQASWERGGADGDLLLLANAEMNLGNDAEALRLADPLLGGSLRADALQLTGVVLERGGQPTEGRKRLDEAVLRFEAGGAAAKAARAHYAIAGSFWREGRYRETLERLDASLVHARTVNDARMIGYVALMRGDVLRAVGDSRGAEREYEEASARLTAGGARAFVLLKQGMLRRELGYDHLSRSTFEEALADAKASGQRAAENAAHLNLAWNARKRGAMSEAQAHLDAWSGGPDFWYFYNLALMRADEGRLDEALTWVDRALSIASGDEAAWDGWYVRGKILHRSGDAAGAERAFEESIRIVERMRAALDLAELQPWVLTERRAPYEALVALHIRAGRDEDALEVLEALSARAFMDSMLARRVSGGSNAVDDAQSFLNAWSELEPPAASMLATVDSADVLIPFEVEGRVYVAWIPAGGVLELLDRGEANQVRALVRRITADPDAADAAAQLGAALLPDALAPGDRPLFIVPTAGFQGIPYAALRRGDRFLVQDRALAIVPSLRAMSVEPTLVASDRVVVFADADGTLPGAAAEAKAIAERFGVAALWGAEADTARLRGTGEAALLHIATHAGIGDRGAWLRMHDSNFEVRDVLACGIRANVVVLASCTSGVSRDAEYAGSLAAAFLANGSDAVIATLASVEDGETRELVRGLYAHDVAARPIQALALAQRDMIPRHAPRAWAPFALYVAGGMR